MEWQTPTPPPHGNFWQWQAGNAVGGFWFGLGWFLAGAGLVEYGRRAIRKMESISYL